MESVCFDLDDTLFDYNQYARAGLKSAADHLEERIGGRHDEELLEIYFDDGITEGTFDVFVNRHGLPSETVDELVEAYHDSEEPLTPYPETERVLTRLGDEYRLGLITDGRGGHAKLRRLGIEHFFDEVLVTPTVGRSKTDPAVFEHVLAKLAVAPEAAVYVGDDPRVDFWQPNEFDMLTVRLRCGRFTDLTPPGEGYAPDHEIHRLDELIGLLDREATPEKRAQHSVRSRRTDGR